MKRVGHLYDRICDLENIKKAILKASLGKRNRKHVKIIVTNLNHYAKKIQEMLINQEYRPSAYSIKNIYDGTSKKERVIYKPRFYPDQIVHWSLILVLEPVLMRGMYQHNCGSVPGRGSSYGQKILRKALDNDYRGTKYCLKLDISKFYPSIDQQLLKNMFRRILKDQKVLGLIDLIIDSTDSGLPIGNYTSQWFANFYLQDMDHFIKENLKIRHYVRYVDDLVILGGNKKRLHQIRAQIDGFLQSKKLNIKNNWQVFLISKRFIDFLGLKFYRERTTLRKTNALRIRRRIVKILRKGVLNFRDACAVISYWGWIKRSDSFRFFMKYFKISLTRAKGVIRNYAKIRCDSGIWAAS